MGFKLAGDRRLRSSCATRPGQRKTDNMSHLTIAFRLIAPVTAAVLLSGCGNSQLSRTFGLTRDTPDEFTVVTRAPLSMPPDYTLRPPEPGTARPQDVSDRALAEFAALVPDAALGGVPAGVSPGQAALVRDAGGGRRRIFASVSIRRPASPRAITGSSISCCIGASRKRPRSWSMRQRKPSGCSRMRRWGSLR